MKYSMMLTVEGAPTEGLTPEITTWRSLDDTAPEIAVPAITQIAGEPIYVFDATLPAGHPDVGAIVDADPGGVNGVPAGERYQYLVITPDDAACTEARMLELRSIAGQVNFRLGTIEFDDQGKMTSCRFAAYANAEDAEAEIDSILVFEVTQTYDAEGNLATYKAVEL